MPCQQTWKKEGVGLRVHIRRFRYAMSFQESDDDIKTVQDLIDFSNRSEESEYEVEVGKIPFYKIKVN